jgi:hypothetical protein
MREEIWWPYLPEPQPAVKMDPDRVEPVPSPVPSRGRSVAPRPNDEPAA